MGLFNYFKTTNSKNTIEQSSNKKLYDKVEKKKNHVYSDNVFFVHKDNGLDYRVEFTTFDRVYFFKVGKMKWLDLDEVAHFFIGEEIKYKIG